MKITIEIDDAHVQSIEDFCASQVRAINDEATGAQRITRAAGHESVEEFVLHCIGQVVDQCVRQYPNEEIRAQMAQAKAIDRNITTAVKPRHVKP